MIHANIPNYGRVFRLVVTDEAGSIDLSDLRVTFQIRHNMSNTPQRGIVRIYNITRGLADRFDRDSVRVTIVAGYENNYAIIFDGKTSFSSYGQTTGTDTYLDLALNESFEWLQNNHISRTFQAGATRDDVMTVIKQSLNDANVSTTDVGALPRKTYRRAKVIYQRGATTAQNMAKEAYGHHGYFFIQHGNAMLSSFNKPVGAAPVKISQSTGMIGLPQVGSGAISVQVLLNPSLFVGRDVHLDLEDVNNPVTIAPAGSIGGGAFMPRSILRRTHGIFRIADLEFIGDSRGNEWYTNLTCMFIPTAYGT